MKNIVFVLLLATAAAAVSCSKPKDQVPAVHKPLSQGQEWVQRIKKNSNLSLAALPELALVDLSGLWLTDHRDATIGYIGKDYKRLKIRILSVKKSKADLKKYSVTGKTMLQNRICAFAGDFELEDALEYAKPEGYNDPGKEPLASGCLFGKYVLHEDAACPAPGDFDGIFTSRFKIVAKGRVQYNDDALTAGTDTYDNNSFVGTWKARGAAEGETCNWGDYRIPFASEGGLDVGEGEFAPGDKFLANGWQEYHDDAITSGKGPAYVKKYAPWWK